MIGARLAMLERRVKLIKANKGEDTEQLTVDALTLMAVRNSVVSTPEELERYYLAVAVHLKVSVDPDHAAAFLLATEGELNGPADQKVDQSEAARGPAASTQEQGTIQGGDSRPQVRKD